MIERAAVFVFLVVAVCGPGSGRLSAQGTVLVTNSPALVPAPTATEYASGTSLFSPTTGAMTVAGTCTASANCSLNISASSTVLSLEYSIISRSGTGQACLGTGPADGVTTAVTTTSTLIEGVKKNQTCTLLVKYRVTSLSYTTHTVAGSPYNQPLTFTITSP